MTLARLVHGLTGPQSTASPLQQGARARHNQGVEETSVSTAEALAEASIVVSGVPIQSFVLAPSGIRPDAICVNFSQHSNFGERASRATCSSTCRSLAR